MKYIEIKKNWEVFAARVGPSSYHVCGAIHRTWLFTVCKAKWNNMKYASSFYFTASWLRSKIIFKRKKKLIFLQCNKMWRNIKKTAGFRRWLGVKGLTLAPKRVFVNTQLVIFTAELRTDTPLNQRKNQSRLTLHT